MSVKDRARQSIEPDASRHVDQDFFSFTYTRHDTHDYDSIVVVMITSVTVVYIYHLSRHNS